MTRLRGSKPPVKRQGAKAIVCALLADRPTQIMVLITILALVAIFAKVQITTGPIVVVR